MKHYQISEQLLLALLQYHLGGDHSREDYICRELEAKAIRISQHEAYRRGRNARVGGNQGGIANETVTDD